VELWTFSWWIVNLSYQSRIDSDSRRREPWTAAAYDAVTVWRHWWMVINYQCQDCYLQFHARKLIWVAIQTIYSHLKARTQCILPVEVRDIGGRMRLLMPSYVSTNEIPVTEPWLYYLFVVTRIRFRAGAGNFYLHYRVQNGSGSQPASYQMGTRGSFPRGKAAGTWSWPLTSI
jgi:hypothetical protein